MRLHSISCAVLLFFGSLMMLFGLWHLLVPKAEYATSNPAPGSVLAVPPQEVSVSFTEELDSKSTMTVRSTITLSPAREQVYGDGEEFASSGPDAADPQRRTLRVKLKPELPAGLYWVQWKAVAARGKAQRFGTLCFGAGMLVPDHVTRDMPGALREHDYQWRGRRAALLGGLFLIALGALLPRVRIRGRP